MIPCRRGSGNFGHRVPSGGWAPARGTLTVGVLAVAALVLVVMASQISRFGSSLGQPPGSSGLRGMLQTTVQERQQQYQGGVRQERLDLEVDAQSTAARLHAADAQAQAAQRAGQDAGLGTGQSELLLAGLTVDEVQPGASVEQPLEQARLQEEQVQQGTPEEPPPAAGAPQLAGSQSVPKVLQPQAQMPHEAGQLAQQQPEQPGPPQAGGGAPSRQQQQQQQQSQQEQQQAEPGARSPYQRALAPCHDLACVTAAAKKKRAPGQFLFPHFFLIGWQKCATTSLFFHLRNHPQMMVTHSKEPEFFSDSCSFQPLACALPAQDFYLHSTLRLGEVQAANLTAAGGEASTHYGRNGQLLARGIYEHFPWLKIVASMREPISRATSMLAHNLDKNSKGCLAKRQIYPCLVKELGRTNYSEPFQAWLDVFPREQVLLIQYENITSEARGREVLRDVKTFLGVDPALPAGEDFIGHNNSRVQRMQRMGELADGQQPQGWPMKRWQYKQLVEMARPDAERLATLVHDNGFADGAEFLAAWEAEWQATLDACTPQGECEVLPN